MSSSEDTQMYRYTPLSGQGIIRVFDLRPGSEEEQDTIHGSLREIELPDHNDGMQSVLLYSALSYTWGSPLDERSTIWIDEEPFEVRQNLFVALTALRHPNRIKTLWIDALCINQEDVFERNHQVALMARIYRMADAIESWLGKADETSETAFECMQAHEIETGNIAVLGAIDALIRRDYWSRSWMVQEVCLARKITLQCGTSRMSWDNFARSCLSLSKYLNHDLQALHLINQRDNVLHGNKYLFNQTLETLIRTYYKCNCSDERDRIFAFLSLASDCASGQGLHADYGLSRLDLLVRTLQFCNPSDPAEFISILFIALGREVGDGLWQAAAERWEAARTVVPDFSNFSNDGLNSDGEVVKITQFAAAISPRKDWARHHSFFVFRERATDAHIQVNFRANSKNQSLGSSGQSTSFSRINQWNTVAKPFDRHLVVISTDQVKAVANMCATLKLHEDSSKCGLKRCVRLLQCENQVR